MTRKGYLSDASDGERAFVAPDLTLMREDAPQLGHSLREVFSGLRYIVRPRMQWRMMPNDLPPWHTVYQQTQRSLKAGVCEDMVHDLRMLMNEIDGRMQRPAGSHSR
jgi:transposase